MMQFSSYSVWYSREHKINTFCPPTTKVLTQVAMSLFLLCFHLGVSSTSQSGSELTPSCSPSQSACSAFPCVPAHTAEFLMVNIKAYQGSPDRLLSRSAMVKSLLTHFTSQEIITRYYGDPSDNRVFTDFNWFSF